MKRTIILAVIMGLSSLMVLQAQDKKKQETKIDTLKTWASMACENCKAKIEKNIAFEKGVKDLKVDLPTKTVTIAYRKDKTNPDKLEKAIQDLGYKTERLK